VERAKAMEHNGNEGQERHDTWDFNVLRKWEWIWGRSTSKKGRARTRGGKQPATPRQEPRTGEIYWFYRKAGSNHQPAITVRETK